MYKFEKNMITRVTDNKVYCHEIEEWVTINEHLNTQAKELQQEIAKKYNLFDELSEFIRNLAKKNGITPY